MRGRTEKAGRDIRRKRRRRRRTEREDPERERGREEEESERAREEVLMEEREREKAAALERFVSREWRTFEIRSPSAALMTHPDHVSYLSRGPAVFGWDSPRARPGCTQSARSEIRFQRRQIAFPARRGPSSSPLLRRRA
eukprot:scaffold105782_cov17-Tisochrysis_lutea.AAC.1